MFNDERKESFIQHYTTSENTASYVRTLFNATGKFEEQYGTDFCQLGVAELQEVIDNVVAARTRSQITALSALREYVKWCLENNFNGSTNNIDKINAVGTSKFKRQMISGPVHLQAVLNCVFDSETDETIDNIYRAYFWFAFSGVDEDDAFRITKANIDLSSMEIVIGQKVFPIYRESLPAIKNSVNLGSLNYIHPKYKSVVRRDRMDGNTALRGIKSNSDKTQFRSLMSIKFSKADKALKTDKNLSYSRVQLAGSFFRMYEKELAGEEISFVDEATEYVMEREYSETKKNTKGHIINRVNKMLIEDYKLWKAIFIYGE